VCFSVLIVLFSHDNDVLSRKWGSWDSTTGGGNHEQDL
jgi:hypothetical protein